jgi:KDO2-lipid IV(A) lauroyltransferase
METLLVCLAFVIFSALPLKASSGLGGRLLRRIGPLLPSHKVAVQNLARALPERAGEHAAILAAMWDNLGRTMAEYAKLKLLGAVPQVEVEGGEHVAAVIAGGKPAIFFAGHLANWEVPARVVKALGLELALVYRAPNNRGVDWLLRRARLPVTRTLIPKGGEGAKTMIRLLQSGHSIGMLVDQKMNDGIAVPFFGRKAMTAPAMVKVAEKYGIPLYPVRCERLNGPHFRVTILPRFILPSTGDKSADTLQAMTAINTMLEGWIRARPAEWLWVHRRWPKEGEAA